MNKQNKIFELRNYIIKKLQNTGTECVLPDCSFGDFLYFFEINKFDYSTYETFVIKMDCYKDEDGYLNAICPERPLLMEYTIVKNDFSDNEYLKYFFFLETNPDWTTKFKEQFEKDIENQIENNKAKYIEKELEKKTMQERFKKIVERNL